eukprot:scaffold23154_cov120-Isochrysis_galbana.AAC.1
MTDAASLLVGGLVCPLLFGWIGDQWCIGKPFPRAFQWCQGRFLWVGRVLVVFVLYLRPMAHWKALFEGFPTVPGAGSVGAWFSYRGRLSVGL